MDRRSWIILGLMMFYMVVLVACGKDGMKKTEYRIDGEWLQCSQPAVEPCGATLICGDRVFTCMGNVEMR